MYITPVKTYVLEEFYNSKEEDYMAKKNNDFFIEKKSWSVVKDELLGCYFMPYVSKILHTHRPLVYVDCFAGKGNLMMVILAPL